MSSERMMPSTAASHTHELKINRDLPPPTPLLSSLLSYWHRCRGDRAMPARNDLDPLHIPKLLPSIMLVDVLRNPLDFRYRLIGTRIVERLKVDHTGSRFSDLGQKAPSDPVFTFAAAIAQEARPGWTEIPYFRPKHLAQPWLLLAMPLSETGQAVDMLLYGADFGSAAVANPTT